MLELAEKIDKKSRKTSDKNMTFEELYEKWLPIYKQKVKQQTYQTALSAYKVVTNWFDNQSIVRYIDAPYIQEHLDDFYFNQGYSYSYTDVLRAFLSNVFEYGKSIGVSDRNIMREVKLKKKKETKDSENAVTEKYLSDEELAEIFDAVRNLKKVWRRERYAEALELLSLTGMRFVRWQLSKTMTTTESL